MLSIGNVLVNFFQHGSRFHFLSHLIPLAFPHHSYVETPQSHVSNAVGELSIKIAKTHVIERRTRIRFSTITTSVIETTGNFEHGDGRSMESIYLVERVTNWDCLLSCDARARKLHFTSVVEHIFERRPFTGRLRWLIIVNVVFDRYDTDGSIIQCRLPNMVCVRSCGHIIPVMSNIFFWYNSQACINTSTSFSQYLRISSLKFHCGSTPDLMEVCFASYHFLNDAYRSSVMNFVSKKLSSGKGPA